MSAEIKSWQNPEIQAELAVFCDEPTRFYGFTDTSDLTDGVVFLQLVKTSGESVSEADLPTYYFDVIAENERVGSCALRIGYNGRTYADGHVQLCIEEPWRGRGHAARVLLLLKQLARRHQMGLTVVCISPQNGAARQALKKACLQYWRSFTTAEGEARELWLMRVCRC